MQWLLSVLIFYEYVNRCFASRSEIRPRNKIEAPDAAFRNETCYYKLQIIWPLSCSFLARTQLSRGLAGLERRSRRPFDPSRRGKFTSSTLSYQDRVEIHRRIRNDGQTDFSSSSFKGKKSKAKMVKKPSPVVSLLCRSRVAPIKNRRLEPFLLIIYFHPIHVDFRVV